MADSPPASGSEPSEDHEPQTGAHQPNHQPIDQHAFEPPPFDQHAFEHRPVMLDEVVELVAPVPAGSFLDATLGGGGHADAILESRSDLHLIGIDRDPSALRAAGERLRRHGDRVTLHRARFDAVSAILPASAPANGLSTTSAGNPTHGGGLSGFLFDLGVSSPQLDRADRGFSFRNDGPLDMRMDPDATLSASDVVNSYDEAELARLIQRNADERFARRIAAAIVAARPIATTAELATVVADAIPAPARRRGGHPARRTFQAIRIAVNDELAILGPTLDHVLDNLAPGGRGIVITYHSGEDRIAKDAFRRRTVDDRPRHLPATGEGPSFQIVRPAARKPTDAEIETNPRAASARLRSIERIAA